ncbi:MAG: efflux RND transporter permease subunit [Gemmatimonadales bacterium]|nr:MAG: efflux RND transporter permease subunit [Gemmatimonadales bacterium]
MLFRFLPRLAVQRPVLATMLILVFVVLGTFSLTQLRTELYPDVEFPVVSITTAYPGAGPEEVEIQVTEPIEDAVSNIANLNNLTSFSRENVSIVVMEFSLDVDPDLAAIDVKDQVDAIRAQLPDGADPPVVQKFDIDQFPVLNVALSGPQGADLLFDLADDQIRERLSRVEGVADISVVGGRMREVEVLVDPVRLEAYDVTLPQIVNLIRSENVTVPSGAVRDEDTQTSVRVVGEYRTIEELADLRLFIADGQVVRLGELATVRDGFGDRDQLARAQRESAVSISVQRQTDANTVETVRALLSEIDDIRGDILPPGAELTVIQDGSLFIQEAVQDVLVSILFGIILTTIILFLFLHSWRGTVIAAVAMPATILSAFLLIDLWGFSLNVMTLLALGVTVGILVTNTIVVLENIYRYLDLGYSPEEAAEEGTAEIGIAVAASVLTNVVVFTPIAFMEGIIGQFFYAFGLTVVFATVFSLLISFILAPLLGARLLRRYEGRRSERTWLAPVWRRWDRGYNGLQSSYQTGLGWALNRPRNGWFVIAGVIVFFVGSLGLSSQFVGGEFLPETDEGIVQIDLELPTDVSIDRTERVVIRAEELLAEVEDVESILSTVAGGTGFQAFAEASNRAQILLNLSDDRSRSTAAVMRQVRPLLAVLPDTDITVQMGGSAGGPGAGAAIQIQVSGPADGLEEVTEQITSWVAEVDGLTDVRNTIEMPRPEIVFRPDRAAVGDVGLTVSEIGNVVRSAIQGDIAGVYRDEGDEIDIRVRFPAEERRRADQIESLMIPVDGGRVPLSSLGTVMLEETAPAIRREDRQRAYDVEAEIASGNLTDRVADVEARLGQESLPPGYSWQTGGEFEDFEEALVEILRALLLAIILTYIVLAMILESFVHPVTIMLTLPLGAAGAFLALMLANVPLNIFAMMAVVMLVGIVVNNAILILDYAGQLRNKGKSAAEALLEAGPIRLRPIIMSNVAIAVALLPQAMGTGAGAAFRIPMAVVTIGGAAVAAVFTLFLIPVIYLKVDTLTDGVVRRLQSVRDRLTGDDDFDEEEFAPSRTP